MDLIDKLKALAQKIDNQKENVKTEESTKSAFIMPFLAALGYDVFDPLEVEPEFIADVGDKKGEKVDYCIKKDNVPAIVIECKHWKDNLNSRISQLERYFNFTKAKFGILTNGIIYQYFTDLDDQNKMDAKPFFEFDMSNLSEGVISEIKKFQKSQFDIDDIVNNASNLKYSKQIRDFLADELKNPSEEFVKHIAQKIYSGRVTAKILEQFQILVQKSAKQMLSDMISDRLKSALVEESEHNKTESTENQSEDIENRLSDDGIHTTEEEIEGFRIVQAILRRDIAVERIVMRDKKQYCGIILDDNNRKPICRLWFNRSQKYIGLFDKEKNEEKVPIETLEDIYQHEQRLIETAKNYDLSEE